MCTISLEYPILHTATEDIVTYKIVIVTETPKFKWFPLFKIKVAKSIIYNFTYRFNKIYTVELDPFELKLGRFRSERGFYSYKDIPYDMCLEGHFVKCIIPRGAKYYLAKNCFDNKQIYHSNQIKIVQQYKSK